MKLRLFVLRDTASNKIIPELFFASKPEAKRERDTYPPGQYVVSPGPDHRRSKTPRS